MPIPVVLSVMLFEDGLTVSATSKADNKCVSRKDTLSYRDTPKVHVDSRYVFQPSRVSSNVEDTVQPKP